MILLTKRLPADHDLFLLGDLHRGAAAEHYSGLLTIKKEIKKNKKFNFFAFMGDDIEAITVDDKRFHGETCNNPIPLQQADSVVEDFKGISDQCVAWLLGNHSLKLHKFGNLTRDIICRQLNTPYGTYSCKVAVHTNGGHLQYKMLLHHGAGSVMSAADDPIRQKSNLALSIKRKLYPLAGDCILSAMGHTHRLIIVKPDRELYLIDDGEVEHARYTDAPDHPELYIDKDLRYYVNSGSLLKLHGPMGTSTYSEMAMYKPIELGCAVVHVRNKKIVNIEKFLV